MPHIFHMHQFFQILAGFFASSVRCALLLAFLCAPLLTAAPLAAADAYMVGFRTLGLWDAQSALRLDVNIWYPSTRPPRELNYAPWEILAARNGKAVEGRFPLLLLSHASSGTRFSHHDTAARLAAQGFVVAAPTHAEDCMDNMTLLFSRQQLESRTRELSASIDLLLRTPEIAESIDKERIGLLGFGAGGTAALLLGGALPDCTSWPDYCDKANPDDAYCNTWAQQRMDALCRSLPFTKSAADPRIKAVAIIAPSYGMLFSNAAFSFFYPPLLLITANADDINRPELHSEAIYRLFDKKPRHIVLENADAGALTAPCPDSLAAELPELCRSVSATERQNIHLIMDDALADFFLRYLGNSGNVPHIPPPPNLSPPPPAPPPAPPPPVSPPQRRRGRS